jgi:5-hydroxyisourate hydrolase
MTALTTHVLDTATGNPASGLRIDLYRVSGNSHKKIGSYETNGDGRVDAPLLSGETFKHGVYELVFYAGEYLDRSGAVTSDPKFLDQIPLRFGISEDRHYHVPLLLSAHGYSTYRGS